MNTSYWEDKMIDSLEGLLSVDESKLMHEAIRSNDTLAKTWNDYVVLYKDFDAVPMHNPSVCLQQKFDTWLKAQSNENIASITSNKMNSKPKIVRLFGWKRMSGVAAIFLCVFGFWKIYNQNNEMGSALASIERMMEVDSPTERIKAIRVNYTSSSIDVDKDMIDVLLTVLHDDESSNVRLAAVEALADFMDKDIVREAFIRALAIEQDGAVKLTILSSLGRRKDQKLKETLDNIVNDDSHQKFIIDEAHMQLFRYDKVKI